MIIADRLIAAMKRMNLSQAELGRRIGLSTSMINKLANGGARETSHIYALARALETTPEYLSGDSDDADAFRMAEPTAPFHTSVQAPPADWVEIAGIDLNFGLGGAFMDQEIIEHQVARMHFPASWVRQITKSPADQLYWTRGVGNSMEPTINDGDVILIDRSKVGSTFGDLYWAIAYGQTGMIKRLRPMPDGSVKILSDNPNVPPETAYDGELSVFGRVIAIVKRV